jgi:hypothetical protein
MVHVLLEDTEVIELPAFEATAHNLSRSGLGLLSRAPLAMGQAVRVYVQTPGWRGRALDGVVARSRKHRDNWYDVGVRFMRVRPQSAAA